jgi:poly-gamma-glutamate synthesis protein (capsule biosynthesis protein)
VSIDQGKAATIALAGDTMLGRVVGEHLESAPYNAVIADEVRDIAVSADLFVLNLECCVSDRGAPWPAAGKPFFFRAPPRAAGLLAWLGVDCVTLANNHALDFHYPALADTLAHLSDVGIAVVGAGPDVRAARAWRQLVTSGGLRLGVLGVSDHPADFAARVDRPGIAYADLYTDVPEWLTDEVRAMADAVDVALVTPHWGANMTLAPMPHVRRAARALVSAGASLIAGHSAHICHGVNGPVLFDLGDFVDDYAVDPDLRNNLSLLFLVNVDATGPNELECVPLRIERCRTRLADADERSWLHHRLAAACAEWGGEVRLTADNRLAMPLR